MFKKILIANRGEIALRVIRACHEMGVQTVAVYSEADVRAPHVREADEAILIGPPPSSESYLQGDRIIEAAKLTGAEAIHPGYGFLSEREWFARAVREAGIVWVGPPAEAIAAMGSKTSARTLASANGVPVVPGTTEPLVDAKEA
ncbi:MAG TPA: biotin carboxylase N-terminal domain-containing protein, partial [Gemmatimonadaceae bacterium]|nr:biotin carboxylase N-terminal domain-containing protein [Gemmatimonadaceae bacterium]